MKREKEKIVALNNYIHETSSSGCEVVKENAFIAGFEIADRTMLDRACKWLAEHISPEEIYEGETNETPTTYLTVNIHTTMLNFINDFRKAMEGDAE